MASDRQAVGGPGELRSPSHGAAFPPKPTVRNKLIGNLAGLLVAIACAGVASIFAGQDANWDLRNYHFYNPWAWLHGRHGWDIAPAQLQSFHNPLIDIPFYAMVAAGWPARWIAFVMGLPAGMAGFALWKVAHLLFRDVRVPQRTVAIVAALVIGLTGIAGVAMLGTTMNEWPGTALVMIALWLVVRDLIYTRHGLPAEPPFASIRLRTLVLAGLLTGLACGLKLTAATFAAGITIALLVRRPMRLALRDACTFAIAVIAGTAITSVHWMALLHAHYGSPLFPYFNQWFTSPLLPPEPVMVRRFGPHTLVEWITFPFDLLRPRAFFVSEQRYRDARFPLLATLALVALAMTWTGRRSAHEACSHRLAAAWRFVGVFIVVSFVIWAAVHSVYRYLLPLELLTGVAIVALILRWVPVQRQVPVLVATALVLVLSTRFPTWGRVPFGDQFLAVQVPSLERNALVILTGDAPMSYVLPYFPEDARHVGIANNLIRPGASSGLDARARSLITGHRGPIYQLTAQQRSDDGTLAAYGLARTSDACRNVTSNMAKSPLALCRVTATPPSR